MIRRYLHTLFVTCGMLLAVPFHQAGAMDKNYRDLLDTLRENGTLDLVQYHSLADALDETDSSHEEDDGDDAKLGGRLMIDLAKYYEDEVDLGDGTELRQARLALEGTLDSAWSYELGVDFADGDADVKDAYAAYQGFEDVHLQIGQFKEPFGLEESTSSGSITFMERGLVGNLAPGRHIGLGFSTHGKSWSVAGGLFGGAFDDDVKDEGDEAWSLSARLTVAPWHKKRTTLHFGVGLSARSPDDEREISFDAGPESNLTDISYLDTDDIDDVEQVDRYGLETALVLGSWSIQAEYVQARIERRQGMSELEFDGSYIYTSWIMTGESRNYNRKKGSFSGLEPDSNGGAWELALRFSKLDLNSEEVTGGAAKQVTLGLNWYANSRTRFMLNYVRVDNDEDANADDDVSGDDDPEVLQLRAQIDF
jgi:phosphate-selective porin OprO/OprP